MEIAMNSLKHVLRLNAASCIIFGGLGVLIPAGISAFLGDAPAWLIQIIGAVLIANGLHLILASMRATPQPWEVLYFSLGDLAWWLGSTFLIAAKIWVTTAIGAIAVFVIGLGVAAMGIAQIWMLVLQMQHRTSTDHWQAIKTSYWAMPKWVFVWLCGLNLVFMLSAFFLPGHLSLVVLVGFAATGPLLLAQIVFDGGLRRILGLGHLVPWGPLWVWLVLHAGDHPYMSALLVVLTICLAFDLYDVWRFWKGEREVFGTQNPIGHTPT